MSRMDSFASSEPLDAQGEKLSVESAEEASPIYRGAAYIAAAIAAIWAVTALASWVLRTL